MNIWMIAKNSMKHHYLKEPFFSHLNIEDIVDADSADGKIIWKDFETKNVAEYHELHLQNDTLLLTDVFEKFRNMFLEIYEPDPAKFFSQPGME